MGTPTHGHEHDDAKTAKTLLWTKYHAPSLRSQVVSRRRVNEILRRALLVPLTLVSAPPGFGKTTAVLAALQARQAESPFALAWLTLDQHDNEPSLFWHYVLAALRVAADLGQTLMAADSAVPVQALLAELLNDIANHPEHVLLVLDDYHLIDHPELHDTLAFFVEHAPGNLHIVLITRADPPMPLHRLRARGQLLEVRAANLRFDLAEAGDFLTHVMGLALTEAEIASLTEQTEGWAAGLQLAALALQDVPSESSLPARHDLIERLAHSSRYIPEYLAEEVLARQDAPMQAFLLQTAILKRLCAPLCDAVTQSVGSQAVLDTLARRNLFLLPAAAPASGSDEHPWFRYHQLFADLLLGQLRQQHPELVPALHQRAAEWYTAHGDVESAVEHALTAGDYARVVDLLNSHAHRIVMQGRVLTIERWLKRLPESWHHMLPRANIAYGWALLLRGRYAEIEPYIAQAEAAVAADDRLLQGELHALRATIADTLGQPETALTHARRALANVLPDDLFTQAVAQTALAGALRASGDVDAAVAAYEQAVPLCHAARLPLPELLSRAHLGYLYTVQGLLRQAEAAVLPALESPLRHPAGSAVHSALAYILLEWNRLDEAEQHVAQAVTLARQGGHNAALVQSHIVLAQLRRAQGDLQAAQAALDTASAQGLTGVPAWIELLLTAERVWLWLEQGAVETAEQLLSQASRALEAAAGPSQVSEVLPMAWAWVRYRQGRCAEAQVVLADVLRAALDQNRQGRVIQALVLRVLVSLAQADEAAARRDLEQALTLAEPEGCVRTFLDAGAPIAALLMGMRGSYARRLLDAFPLDVRQQVMTAAALPEPLTERESQVLRLMAHGLTYRQIADELVVSINTVRHHVKGIYSKLDADTRTRALEKARTLNLL